MSGENGIQFNDFATLSRLALSGSREDLVAFLRKVARRVGGPESEQIRELLHGERAGSITRGMPTIMPVDADSRLELLRTENPSDVEPPILPEPINESLRQLIEERGHLRELEAAGLHPARTALFVGPPGVGKTLSARWLASELGMPLFVLDLSAVMSSFLGRTGNNIRNVLNYAKGEHGILLLDEFDAIAKRRDDAVEVGELKRLVTVLLQEIDSWPEDGLLIAATNHEELLDPAIWRRFDKVLRFDVPDQGHAESALRRFVPDCCSDKELTEALAIALSGMSYSEIEREVLSVRRESIVRGGDVLQLLAKSVKERIGDLKPTQRKKIALALFDAGMNKSEAKALTGVARDTLRAELKKRGTD